MDTEQESREENGSMEYQEMRKQTDWLRKELEKSSQIHMSHTIRRKR
jgi:GMP synthase-like glutamine amidotransferase